MPVNERPTVNITSPLTNSVYSVGALVTFQGNASDVEDGTLTHAMQWSSNLDGILGTGGVITSDALSIGAHVIAVSV